MQNWFCRGDKNDGTDCCHGNFFQLYVCVACERALKGFAMFGLIDCNNFFVSCERIFRPELEGRPVVVMSNNDGCAVSMSNEAKALGITRGKPMFEVRDIIKRHNVATISGNHRMYGDISARVMSTIGSVAGDVEIYSIDEAFIQFPNLDNEGIQAMAREIVRRVHRWTGIPTSLGIAPTRTLAKVAAGFAKKYPSYRNVCAIDNDEKRCKALSLIDIESVWGVGRRLGARLRRYGIVKAIDFADLPETQVGTIVNLTGHRTWKELNGFPCIEADAESGVRRKQISTTRTFSPCKTGLEALEEAVASFMAIAARKLRLQDSCATGISVFIQTNQYRPELEQYVNSVYRRMSEPTADSMTLIKEAMAALHEIYRPGLLYRRAGVHITDIVSSGEVQHSLFSSVDDRNRRERLMKTMDALNTSPRTYNMLRTAICNTDPACRRSVVCGEPVAPCKTLVLRPMPVSDVSLPLPVINLS